MCDDVCGQTLHYHDAYGKGVCPEKHRIVQALCKCNAFAKMEPLGKLNGIANRLNAFGNSDTCCGTMNSFWGARTVRARVVAYGTISDAHAQVAQLDREPASNATVNLNCFMQSSQSTRRKRTRSDR